MHEQDIFPIKSTVVPQLQHLERAIGGRNFEARVSVGMKLFHPELYTFISEQTVTFPQYEDSYLVGVTLMYAAILTELAEREFPMPLTPDDIALHRVNILDQHINDVDGRAITAWLIQASLCTPPLQPTADRSLLIPFMNRVQASAPDLYDEFKSLMDSHFTSDNQRIGLFRGYYDAYMPFYRKHEADYLENDLIIAPRVLNALRHGYYGKG